MPKIALNETVLQTLKQGKHLLAFSGGGDSTALFHLLLEQNIAFDIAHVNYQTRAQSDEEEAYVRTLAKHYRKRCFIHHAPPIKTNFEATARKVRYKFFHSIIQKECYDTLITAHHLNDRLEWFLMRLSKGAGIAELSGMQSISTLYGMSLVRPLLDVPKKELLSYLKKHNITYFEDVSNLDERIERNYFRHRFANELIQNYAQGIAKTFTILDAQQHIFDDLFELIYTKEELSIYKLLTPKIASYVAQRALKQKGYLITGSERERIDSEPSVVVGRKWAVEKMNDLLFIAPYLKDLPIPKQHKEGYRRAKVPAKIRPYLTTLPVDTDILSIVIGQ